MHSFFAFFILSHPQLHRFSFQASHTTACLKKRNEFFRHMTMELWTFLSNQTGFFIFRCIMSQKDFLTPKPKTVEILSFRWCGIVTSTQAGELECSRCDKPIGNKKPFGIAFIKNRDSNKQESLRLCNECGLEAEAKLSEQ